MSYFYDYTGTDQDLLVESEEPRPDLLEWAYWREVTAAEAKALRLKKSEPDAHAEHEPVAPTESEAGDASEPESEPAPAEAKKAPVKRAPKAVR